MKVTKHVTDVIKLEAICDESGWGVEDGLQTPVIRNRRSKINAVTVVNSAANEGVYKCFSSIRSKKAADGAQLTKLKEAWFHNTANMRMEIQLTVK